MNMTEIAQLREAVLGWLSEQVPESRIQHILRVEKMAHELATVRQLDRTKAQLAGLMHDLAKNFKPKVLWKMANEAGLAVDEVLEANPHLLHADVSAIVARKEFGVEDEEILQAIANHTLGNPGMDELSCTIYLADSLEPGRGNTPQLESLRTLCKENLERAVWQTADYSIQHLLAAGRLIHPRTISTRNWFLQKAKKSGSLILTKI
jgi:predicted HD superfamily hydrolase involved in NAD metabolism